MEPIKLDDKKLQEMAEQYAMKGAEQAIKDFYTGYQSPFMEEVQRQLKERLETNLFFELPTMTAAINQALNDKISEMANTVVASTFIPMINRMFTGERKAVVTTQDLFEHFGDAMKEDLDDEFDAELLELQVGKSNGTVYEHRDLYFCYDNDKKYELSLMSSSREPKADDKGNIYYIITSLPGCGQYRLDTYPRERQMRIRLNEGATLEMPFTPDVLRDEFMRFVANLLICNSKVVISRYHEYHNNEDY